MGMEKRVEFASGTGPSWPAIATELTKHGERPVLRMIDGELAFPDETPPDDWQELRIGLSGGMVSIRRLGDDAITCIVWGNADTGLIRSWELLAEAIRHAS